MRQSLSDSGTAARTTTLAVALSAVLAAATAVDHAGAHSLIDHATALYAPSGTPPDPALLYGLVYAVAAVEALLWLAVLHAVRSSSRWTTSLTVAVVAITAALGALLLTASEYGQRIFPPLWGVLALLPAVAGFVSVVLLRRRAASASRAG
jgi:hypothetical protein